MTDHHLEAAVLGALAESPRVRADEIAVEASDGDVLLRGTVGSPLQRVEAVRAAGDVPGVRAVVDHLKVRLMDIDGRADADTEAAVLEALIYDEEVHAADVDVAARDGVVKLTGTVEAASQRERAARVAGEVGGVRRVLNHLRVWVPEG
jgi:osmotically-inducible protein OsmY